MKWSLIRVAALLALTLGGATLAAQETPPPPPSGISPPPPPPEVPDPAPGPRAPAPAPEAAPESESEKPERPATPASHLPASPHAELRVSLFTGLPDLFSASLSITAFQPLEVEVGASYAFLIASVYARAGGRIPIGDGRDPWGRGWTSHLVLLAGYRSLSTFSLLGSGGGNSQNLTGNVGLDAVLWSGPGFGLDLQFILGAAYALTNRNVSQWFPDARFAIGLAF